jgi:hypothetical protein
MVPDYVEQNTRLDYRHGGKLGGACLDGHAESINYYDMEGYYTYPNHFLPW